MSIVEQRDDERSIRSRSRPDEAILLSLRRRESRSWFAGALLMINCDSPNEKWSLDTAGSLRDTPDVERDEPADDTRVDSADESLWEGVNFGFRR